MGMGCDGAEAEFAESAYQIQKNEMSDACISCYYVTKKNDK